MSFNFKTKLILGFVAIGVVPLVLVGGYLLYSSYEQAYEGGRMVTEALHDESSGQIEAYFDSIKKQTQERARARTTVEALRDFSAIVRDIHSDAGVDEAKLEERYRAQAAKTPDMKPEEVLKLMPTSPAARALQFTYIAANPNPIGEKDKLKDAGDGSAYSAAHAKYHVSLSNYTKMFGFYDVMLVDADSGDVVYTAFKEIDFMSNVKTGPLSQTIFAKTARKAMELQDPNGVVLSDFEAYAPSYGDWAAFVAAPVVENGKTIGAVVYQIPSEKLTTFFQGVQMLGKTGDGFLVGEDMKLRSKPMTLNQSIGGAIPANLADHLGKVFKDNFSGIDEWAGGNAGNVPLYGAMQMLNVPDFKWAVVVRVEKHELLHNFYRQLAISLGLMVLVVALAVGLGILFGNTLVKPIQGLARGFNAGQVKVQQSAIQMGEAVSSMIAASEETSAQSKVIRQSSNEAAGYVSSVSGAIEELNISIHDISQSIGETNILIDDAVAKAQKTDEVVRSLGEASRRITEVVSLINDLAEQTNLLALNAAIEAARAGDAGRGFAVVADEVKKLASHTSEATVDIKSQVDEVQDVSSQSVVALQAVVEAIHRIRDNATTVSAAVEEQSGVARQIAGSIKEAAGRVQDVDRNMTGIDQAANDTGIAAEQVNRSMGEVTSAVSGMKTGVETVLDDMGVKA